MTVDIRQSTANPVAVDTGNIAIQGRVVSKTIQLAMFTMNENAVWAGKQHLLKSSYPFAMLKIVCNRYAFRLNIGDCFKFSYSKYGINNAIFRVIMKEEHELESENIVISAIEDFYYISRSIEEYSTPSDHTIPRPDYKITPFQNQKAIEVPYAVSQTDEIRILFLAERMGVNDLGFDVYMSIDNGNSYSLIEDGIGNLTAHGVLVESYPANTFTIDSEIGFTIEFNRTEDISLIETTTWANTLAGIENIGLLGDEIIFFKTITPITEKQYKIENIIRGRMDTQKTDHPAGEKFYFIRNNMTSVSHQEILPHVNRDFKLVPYNIRKRGNLSEATPIDFDIKGRARTPYIPANFCANGSSFCARYDSDIVLTWSPRFRGRGAGVGLPGNVIAENSREGLFNIEVYVNNAKKREVTNIDNYTWTYTSSMNIADNGTLANEVKFYLSNYKIENGVLYSSEKAVVICKKNP